MMVPGDLRSPITLRDLIETSIGLAGPIVRAQSDYTLHYRSSEFGPLVET